MRTVLAVHHFPPRYTSGAELRAYRTACWLRERGHEVHVVCVEAIDAGDGRGLSFEDGLYDGLRVRRLRFDLAAAPDRFRWTYDNGWIGEHLRGYLTELAPDVLHLISGYLMSGSTLRAASEVGVPTVVTLTDFWFLCPRITLLRSNGQVCAPPFDGGRCARCLGEEKRRYRIPGRLAPGLMEAFWRAQRGRAARIDGRTAFLRDTLKLVDAIISPSLFLREVYMEAGMAPREIIFCRQGRDFPGLTPEMLDRSTGVELRIGYMGQINPTKGVHVLIQAVRRLPAARVRVKIYGDTARFPAYVRRLRRLAAGDDRIVFAGTYDAAELGGIMAETDVVVVPSVWYENSPNVILEAQAYGRPVVASAQGGMAELVRDGVDGLLFVPGDADDLARQLGRLVGEREFVRRLAANAPPVKGLEKEMMELEAVYRGVVGRGGTGREG